MNTPRIFTTLAVAAAAAAIALAGAGPASAQGGAKDVRASGHCSAGSVWKIKAKPDNSRIQLELEVDTNRVGQTWAVGITDNNVRVFSGNRVTTAPSGSFSVRVLTANRAGTDSFVGTARNLKTGQTCTARVRL
jgi:hypothetical protein